MGRSAPKRWQDNPASPRGNDQCPIVHPNLARRSGRLETTPLPAGAIADCLNPAFEPSRPRPPISGEACPGFSIGRFASGSSVALVLHELNFDLPAVDADKFAAAIGQTRQGQQQKELLEIEALDRAID